MSRVNYPKLPKLAVCKTYNFKKNMKGDFFWHLSSSQSYLSDGLKFSIKNVQIKIRKLSEWKKQAKIYHTFL